MADKLKANATVRVGSHQRLMQTNNQASSRKREYRILMTADTVGGVWDYALELSRALMPHDCQVVLATMGTEPSRAQQLAAAQLNNLTLCPSTFRLEWMDEPWPEVEAAGRWLLDLEAAWMPDIVHLNSYVHGAIPWRAPVLIVGHSCVVSWFAAVRGQGPGPQWDEYRRRVSRGLSGAAQVTAPSAAMLRALRQQYGRFSAATPIYNGRSAEDFRPDHKEPLILGAARLWDDAKNLRILESIAPRLAWPVYIAGDNRPPGAGSPAAISSGISLLGRLDQATLAGWLGRAAIFVHPARYEPFGLAVLEAALAGCALVLGDIPSLREIWHDAALYVAPTDAEAIERELQNLIASPERRRSLGRAARQRALRFSPARMAHGYMKLYRELTSGFYLRQKNAAIESQAGKGQISSARTITPRTERPAGRIQ
jgi:glycogen synthase